MELITVISKTKKRKLYQWDLDRKVKITPPEGVEVDEVHFAHPNDKDALVVKIYSENNELVADVPNILLQEAFYIDAYLVSGGQTICRKILTVVQKPKPKDYVYTETEILRYEALEKRIEAIENSSSGAGGKDGVGILNVEQTTTSNKDGGTNVITVTKTDGTSSTFQVLNGSKGSQGEKGEQGIQGLKGDKGDVGEQGIQGVRGDTGEKGADGISVTVLSVSESAEDGGSNVVIFSDGKSVTIKNGSKGSIGEKGDKGDTGAQGPQGYTPIKGTDYFTEADKEEIAQIVLESLPAAEEATF